MELRFKSIRRSCVKNLQTKLATNDFYRPLWTARIHRTWLRCRTTEGAFGKNTLSDPSGCFSEINALSSEKNPLRSLRVRLPCNSAIVTICKSAFEGASLAKTYLYWNRIWPVRSIMVMEPYEWLNPPISWPADHRTHGFTYQQVFPENIWKITERKRIDDSA